MRKLLDKITAALAARIGRGKAETAVQLACFCFVGGINTLVDMGVFSLFYYLVFGGNDGLRAIPFTAGYLAGVVCSFILNRTLTFRSKGSVKKQWLPFLIVNLITLGIGQGALALLGTAGIEGILAKLITVPVTLIINFIGSRLIVFRKEPAEKE